MNEDIIRKFEEKGFEIRKGVDGESFSATYKIDIMAKEPMEIYVASLPYGCRAEIWYLNMLFSIFDVKSDKRIESLEKTLNQMDTIIKEVETIGSRMREHINTLVKLEWKTS